jgi:hypothetical protein
MVFVALTLAIASASVVDLGLRDHPIESSGPTVYLDGQAADGTWTATTMSTYDVYNKAAHPPTNITVPATVPGDLITDLQRADVISDPWLDLTWIQRSFLWSNHVWTYSTHFTVTSNVLEKKSALLLVFDGVKMGATLRVNGQVVGVLRDQFLRYSFELTTGLQAGVGSNLLEVTFGIEDVAEDGRFMVSACLLARCSSWDNGG